MRKSGQPSLRADLVAGIFMAGLFSCVAAIPFGLVALANLVRLIHKQSPELPWRTLGAMALVVLASYTVASQVGALAFFVLRPLRRSVLGWMATGFVLATIAYGTIGLALAVFYDPVGREFLTNSTEAEAWQMVRFAPVLGLVGLVAGVWLWWKARHRARA
jgi:hypothetical protein